MYRLLIVEDMADTKEGLILALQDEYDGWRVEGAGTVEEAKAAIDQSAEEEQSYDLVVLDYLLPNRTGEAPAGSLALTEYALTKLPDALIIQVTAYLDDEQLQDKLIHPMLMNPDPRVIFVEKKLDNWARTVSLIARGRLLGDPIAERLDDLFGSQATLHSRVRSRQGQAIEPGSLTSKLASLRGLIMNSWDYLPQDLQARIRGRFRVDDSQRPVRITML